MNSRLPENIKEKYSQYFTAIPLYENCNKYPIDDIIENNDGIIDITLKNRRIHYDATYHKNNYNGALTNCYIRKEVYNMLCKAINLLDDDFSFLIFDSLRPLDVQQALFDEYYQKVKSENPALSHEQILVVVDDFVAKPTIDFKKPAPHSTGGAVDLTLCYKNQPLNMGTLFDDFTSVANTDYIEKNQSDFDENILNNRRLFYNIMVKSGFANYECEWWHFSYGDRGWARKTGKTPFYSCVLDKI